MKRQEFLDELASLLKSLEQEDIDNALDYYNEYLNDADILKDDDEVVGFETPTQIAKKILEEIQTGAGDKAEDKKPSVQAQAQADPKSDTPALHDFTRIDIDVITCDIMLIKSDKNAVEYEIGKWERLVCCKVDEATKTLVIKTKRPPFMISLGALTHRGFVKIYYVNEADFESVSLRTVSGLVNVNGLNLKQISIETVSGSISAQEVHASRISCESISGAIRLNSIGRSNENVIRAQTVSGRIEIDRLKTGEARLENTSGSIILNNSATKRLNIQTVSGSITANGALEGNSELNAVSGKIAVETTIPFGEYDYAVTSMSGRTTVNQNNFKGSMITGKNNLIKANTVSGRISIDFAVIH